MLTGYKNQPTGNQPKLPNLSIYLKNERIKGDQHTHTKKSSCFRVQFDGGKGDGDVSEKVVQTLYNCQDSDSIRP